ncbi:MAG: segregation/condensation protein A [Clostridia bacterium]|nr:segregation/condensation protein A [Clostridia bacterium]
MMDEEQTEISENQNEVLSAGKLNIKLDSFEGPFDLLLSLIDKQKIEITDVPISVIADQYIDIIFAAGGFNVDIAGEFLVMASALLHMKTRKLLPKPLPETEEMTEEQLVERLVIYKQFKEVAEKLSKDMEYWSNARYRVQENIDFPKKEETIELSVDELAMGYERAKLRFETLRNDNTEKMEVILKIEKVSLKDKLKQIIGVLARKTKVKFSEIFGRGKSSKPETVTGFLAILELNRRKSVDLVQKQLFGEIEIIKAKDDMTEGLTNLEGYDEWD